MYATLVLQFHLDPEWVLDRASLCEIRTLYEYNYLNHKDNWEQARFIAYCNTAKSSKKRLTQSAFFELPWEKKERKQRAKSQIMSDEQLSALQEKAKMFEKKV